MVNLQSRTFKTEDDKNRTIVEIKAKRIQFLNKFGKSSEEDSDAEVSKNDTNDIEDNSFDKFLNDEESNLMNDENN